MPKITNMLRTSRRKYHFQNPDDFFQLLLNCYFNMKKKLNLQLWLYLQRLQMNFKAHFQKCIFHFIFIHLSSATQIQLWTLSDKHLSQLPRHCIVLLSFKLDMATRLNAAICLTIVLVHFQVRLLDGHKGMVEVLYPGRGFWKPLCGQFGWDDHDKAVVCRQLGLGSAVSSGQEQSSNHVTSPVLRLHMRCRGDESDLISCLSNGECLACEKERS